MGNNPIILSHSQVVQHFVDVPLHVYDFNLIVTSWPDSSLSHIVINYSIQPFPRPSIAASASNLAGHVAHRVCVPLCYHHARQASGAGVQTS